MAGFCFFSFWLAFSLFNAFFSQRPYTHYVLVLLPAFCLAIGLFILNKNYSKLAGVLMLSVFILVLLNFNLYSNTPFYYQNFISFIFAEKRHRLPKIFRSKHAPGLRNRKFYRSLRQTDRTIFISGATMLKSMN